MFYVCQEWKSAHDLNRGLVIDKLDFLYTENILNHNLKYEMDVLCYFCNIKKPVK